MARVKSPACTQSAADLSTGPADTFRKRAASDLQSGRGFVLPPAQEQVHEKTGLELVIRICHQAG